MNRPRILTVALLALAAAPTLTAQNPYVRTGSRIAAVADQRARHVGDILTVIVKITDEATRRKVEPDARHRQGDDHPARAIVEVERPPAHPGDETVMPDHQMRPPDAKPTPKPAKGKKS